LNSNIFLALIHYPVKQGEKVITSSITNLDIHDISRVASTYGLGGYFVIHPDSSQRAIAEKLAGHWITGKGKDYNSDRHTAFKKLNIVSDLDQAINTVVDRTGNSPLIVGTSAIKNEKNVSISEIKKNKKPLLILFGTAGGMADQLFDKIDCFAEPIDMGSGYNHLSVRSAVAIFIDRLTFSE